MFFFFSSRRRHTRYWRDWSSDVCSSDLWQTTHTVVEMVNDDMPFLVDSTRMEINRQGYGIHLMIHPMIKVRRDPEGQLVEVLPYDSADEDAISESVIRVEVDRQTESEVLEDLHSHLERVLEDVRVAVEDWPQMRERVQSIVSGLEENASPVGEDELEEAHAFLEWLHDDNFTFLGYREYDLFAQDGEDALRAVPESGLGILRETSPETTSHSFARLSPAAKKLARAPHQIGRAHV